MARRKEGKMGQKSNQFVPNFILNFKLIFYQIFPQKLDFLLTIEKQNLCC